MKLCKITAMKTTKILLFLFSFISTFSFGQDIALEDLPNATINENYSITLSTSVPLTDYYKVDISHLDFTDAAEAQKTLTRFVTGNLITNQVFYEEHYMLIHIHTEYLGGNLDLVKVQNYLTNSLPKP
jgi:hypothetical protein